MFKNIQRLTPSRVASLRSSTRNMSNIGDKNILKTVVYNNKNIINERQLGKNMTVKNVRYMSEMIKDEKTIEKGGETSTETSTDIETSTVTSSTVDVPVETINFQAETKKLLNIVTHSLYKDKHVFLREQISNASDALEKLRFITSSATTDVTSPDLAYKIILNTDPVAKTFSIQDTGVGMTKTEVIDNLGVIAKSGTQGFVEKLDQSAAAQDLIGQFGVGFYSSFVVSKKVEVFTKSYNEAEDSKGWHWVSDGGGNFTIRECENLQRGTKIVCHLKDDSLEFCNLEKIKSLAHQHSQFVGFPLNIVENGTEHRINTQEALWMNKNATEEQHIAFFRHLSGSSTGEPLYSFAYHTDAPISIKSVFYIPEEAPSRLFQTKNEVKVSLHCRKVLVKKCADDIIPKWLFYIQGIVDSEDIPLNISRETMQNERLIERISSTLVRRILRFLEDESKANPEKYEKFYKGYSYYLKEGFLDEAQKNGKFKEQIAKLLRFEASQSAAGESITLQQYIETMKPSQQNIYYFCASDRNTAMSSPYMEDFCKKGRNVLLLFEEIDEFVAMNMQTFKDKKLVAVDSPEEDFEPALDETPEETSKTKKISEHTLNDAQRQEIEAYVKSVLGSRLSAVKFSERLINSPAVATGFLSSTLRKMMKATLRGSDDGQMSMANLPVTLELNPSHKLITYLVHLIKANPDVAKILTEQVYDNACIAAGIMDDPRSMLTRLNSLLEVTAQYAYHHNSEESTDMKEEIENTQEETTTPKAETSSSAVQSTPLEADIAAVKSETPNAPQ